MEESFARRTWTDARLLKRSCESLLGINAGILADGELNNQEIRYLENWLCDNMAIASTWPGEVIYSRIKTIFADNKITEDEREHLKQTLSDLIGFTLQETGAAFGASINHPINEVDLIRIRNNIFCFTGNFLYGTATLANVPLPKEAVPPFPE